MLHPQEIVTETADANGKWSWCHLLKWYTSSAKCTLIQVGNFELKKSLMEVLIHLFHRIVFKLATNKHRCRTYNFEECFQQSIKLMYTYIESRL